MRKLLPPVAALLPLAGGVKAVQYEWLPDTTWARRYREFEAERMDQEHILLLSVHTAMPPCACLNVLADACNQRRRWAMQLRSKTFRQVPVGYPKLYVWLSDGVWKSEVEKPK